METMAAPARRAREELERLSPFFTLLVYEPLASLLNTMILEHFIKHYAVKALYDKAVWVGNTLIQRDITYCVESICSPKCRMCRAVGSPHTLAGSLCSVSGRRGVGRV